MERAMRIWRAFKTVKLQAEVIRSGFALYGIYEVVAGGFDRLRSESDLEHAGGLAELLSMISRWYPELISKDERLLYLELARIHDVGETVVGDIPDDGTQNVAEKNQSERAFFQEFTESIPADEAEELLDFFVEFQLKNTRRGQIMYLADKLEAVLQALVYESEGRAGAIGGEPTHIPSIQDMDLLQCTDDPRTATIWACHFRGISEQFPELREPFIEILRAAVLDVRGEWFSWWK